MTEHYAQKILYALNIMFCNNFQDTLFMFITMNIKLLLLYIIIYIYVHYRIILSDIWYEGWVEWQRQHEMKPSA